MAVGDDLENALDGNDTEGATPLTPDIEDEFNIRDLRQGSEPPPEVEPAGTTTPEVEAPQELAGQGDVNLGEMMQVANQTPEDSPGTFQRIGNALRSAAERTAEPDVAQLLASLGAQLTPQEQDPLAEFAIQTARGEARRRFREQINEEGTEEASDAQIRGLQPQDRQQVLQQEREQDLAEAEQEVREQRADTQQQRVEQRGELTDAQIEEIKANIRQEDEALDIERTQAAIAQGELDLQEEQLALEKLNAEVQREAQSALAELRRARADLATAESTQAFLAGGGGRGGGRDLGDLVNDSDQTLGALRTQSNFLAEKETRIRSQLVAANQGVGPNFGNMSEEERQQEVERLQNELEATRKERENLESQMSEFTELQRQITSQLTQEGDALEESGEVSEGADVDSTDSRPTSEDGEELSADDFPGSGTPEDPIVVKDKEEMQRVKSLFPPQTRFVTEQNQQNNDE